MPKITVDGQEIEAPAGTTVLAAALSRGQVIPHYCYHPGLSIAGNCRMCLVEMEKAPKLVIACATQVAEGQVIRTQTDRVKKAQAAVMEFLLINHPLDCTICDQAGECRLQEYAVEHGSGKSRYVEPKVLLSKAVDIGAHVMLDQERCIQCSRCIRFCDEVTKTGELAFFQRSDRTIIGIYPGKRLDNLYSGNTVDICPVGALTLKEFRFKTRVWYLKNTPSICAACTRGCNVVVAVGRQQEMWTTRGQFDDRIKRIVPRANEEVNGHWMCDIGRLAYEPQQDAPRLFTSQAPAGASLEWDEAVTRATAWLKPAAAIGRAGAIFSPRLPTESYHAWRILFEKLGTVQIGLRTLVRGEDDNLLLRADRGGNSLGGSWVLGERAQEASVLAAAAAGAIDTLVVFGDPLDPADTVRLPEGIRAQIANVIFIGPFLDETARGASLLMPSAAWSEEDGSFVNFQGRVQWTRRCHLPQGEGRPGWRIALDVATAAGVELPPWSTAADVLNDLGAAVDAFAGLTAERIGLLGVAAGSPAAAAGS